MTMTNKKDRVLLSGSFSVGEKQNKYIRKEHSDASHVKSTWGDVTNGGDVCKKNKREFTI